MCHRPSSIIYRCIILPCDKKNDHIKQAEESPALCRVIVFQLYHVEYAKIILSKINDAKTKCGSFIYLPIFNSSINLCIFNSSLKMSMPSQKLKIKQSLYPYLLSILLKSQGREHCMPLSTHRFHESSSFSYI